MNLRIGPNISVKDAARWKKTLQENRAWCSDVPDGFVMQTGPAN